MQKSIWLWAGLVLTMHGSVGAQGSAPERGLVDAEHAFAQAVAQQGIKGAFLAYLADDAIVFSPGPLPGKKVYADRPASPSLLAWHPVFVESSSSGDLGYTTGPYDVRKNPSEQEPVAFGEYLSIWRRGYDSTWHVVLDAGISHPRPEKQDSGLEYHSMRHRTVSDGVSREMNVSSSWYLLSLDREFSKRLAARSYAGALRDVASADIRLLRGGAFPALGRDSVRALVEQLPRILSIKPVGGSIARSGDLGYTYGTVHMSGNAESSYVRIWRKERGEWRVAVDLMTR